VVLCHSGSRSALATQQLKKKGLTRLANIRAGIRAWKVQGLPLEHPAATPPQGHDPAALLKLVADCFGDEAAAVALDPVGSRPAFNLIGTGQSAPPPRLSSAPLLR
jgi:hypothetical protein